jgi:hypothetical protein
LFIQARLLKTGSLRVRQFQRFVKR